MFDTLFSLYGVSSRLDFGSRGDVRMYLSLVRKEVKN